MIRFVLALCALPLAFSAAAQAATTTDTQKSAASLDCSKQADAKGLHGKDRKTFRAECKKELKSKASTSAAKAPEAAKVPDAAKADSDSKAKN